MNPATLVGQSLTALIASNYALLQPTLVPVQGGTFMMSEGSHYPNHEVTLSTYQMGRTPVTWENYYRHIESLGGRHHALIGENAVTGTEGVLAVGSSESDVRSAVETEARKEGDVLVFGGLHFLPDSLKVVQLEPTPSYDMTRAIRYDRPREHIRVSSNHPVINVSWYDAFVYAFLHGGILPTVWQWEYAARVVQGKEGLRDYATPSGCLTHEEVHYEAKSTADVDDPRYPTLENGLRHMTGNVREWLQNWSCRDVEEPAVDPTRSRGDELIGYKAVRGGEWGVFSRLLATYHDHEAPQNRMNSLGFRVAAPMDPKV